MPDSAMSAKQLGVFHMAAQNNVYEPLRTNNFEFQITDLEHADNIMFSVASYSAPNLNITPIEVQYGNNSIKYAGKPTFDNSNLTINDFVGIETEEALSNWMKLVYNYDTQEIGFASEYKKECYLIEYNTKGEFVRQWKLIGCWPSTLTLGDFNQDGNAVRQISMTITYDYAIPYSE